VEWEWLLVWEERTENNKNDGRDKGKEVREEGKRAGFC
jgi:hypothetical protein